MKVGLVAVAALLFAGAARADGTDSTIYTYTGNTLNNSGPGSLVDPSGPVCQCNITGELTFAVALDLPEDIQTVTGTPSSYSFSVDGHTLTQKNSTIEEFNLGELWWNLIIVGKNGLTIETVCQDGCGDDGGATDWAGFAKKGFNGGIGVEFGNAGKWATTVPEPPTNVMAIAAMLGLFAYNWRWRRCR
jgi:hypothetical protein